MSGSAFIELDGIDVVHEDSPGTCLVRDVHWRIAPDDFWIVGGDQATGKTSLLATAAGLNRPAGGMLRIFGRELATASEAEQIDWRRRIGFVYEGGGRLFSDLSVTENIALPLDYHLGLDEAKRTAQVRELLKMVELENVADVKPSRLSLRLRARTALARALAVPTEVLFLDNPLTGFAPREARWWLEFARKLHTDRKTSGQPIAIVVSCSDFRGWRTVADRFAMIQNSQFQVIGGREQLEDNQVPAIREFIASTF